MTSVWRVMGLMLRRQWLRPCYQWLETPMTWCAQQTLAPLVRSLCTAFDRLFESYFSLKPEDSGELALGWALFPLLGNLERPELQSAPDPFENASGEGFNAAASPSLPGLRSARLFGYVPANIPLVPGGVSDEQVYDEKDGGFWGGLMPGPLHNSTRRAIVLGLGEALAFPHLAHPTYAGHPNGAPMTMAATTILYTPDAPGRTASGTGRGF
ncbi:hypothetical protein DL765_007288 [Monosporascus sp. GIB2]|nr:hypothetical protein DL765_007288 [Monosporascus sp. GIB2]